MDLLLNSHIKTWIEFILIMLGQYLSLAFRPRSYLNQENSISNSNEKNSIVLIKCSNRYKTRTVECKKKMQFKHTHKSGLKPYLSSFGTNLPIYQYGHHNSNNAKQLYQLLGFKLKISYSKVRITPRALLRLSKPAKRKMSFS